MSIRRQDLEHDLNQLLDISNFKDYGPNGMQIEGKTEISRIAFAVSATRDSIAKAVAFKADALIVHHGLFWRFHGPKTITGPFAKRVMPLVKNDISLFGYHLPLDSHPIVGNAAQIANKLDLQDQEAFGEYKRASLGIMGKFQTPQDKNQLKAKLESILGHTVLHSDPNTDQIKNIGIITGGANSEWYFCQHHDVDAYLTGEMSEHDWNEAKEAGVHFFAGGHHATERFGVMALQEYIQSTFGIAVEDTLFIDSSNPA